MYQASACQNRSELIWSYYNLNHAHAGLKAELGAVYKQIGLADIIVTAVIVVLAARGG